MKGAPQRLALALLLLLGGVIALLSRGDGEPPDDADLMQTAAPIPDHENGYVTLQAASALIQWPDSDALDDRLLAMASGGDWDAELASRALADNERALAIFARVARNRAFQSPPDPQPALAPTLGGVQLARLLAIRARSATEGGEPAAAVEDALLALRVGKRIGTDPHGGFRSGQLAMFVGNLALDAIADALPALELDAAATRALARELEAHRVDPAAWRAMLAANYRAERLELLTAARAPAVSDAGAAYATPSARRIAGWLPNRYLIQPNNSLAALGAQVRDQQSRANEPCKAGEEQPAALQAADLLRPNAIGRRHLAAAQSGARFDVNRCEYDTHVEMTRAALAVRAFERDRGAAPPSLAALVPGYLDSAPVDGFSGTTLRFDRPRRVVYSIGSDQIDEGGRAIEGDTEAREPRFALPPLEAS